MNQHLRILCIALLIALAGCGGSTAVDEQNTPELVTNESNESIEITYPDGTSENGITNLTALGIEHHRTLSEEDYIRQTTYSGPNKTVNETVNADWDNKNIIIQRHTTVDGGTVHSTIYQEDLNLDQYTIHRAPNGTVSYEERDRHFIDFKQDYAIGGNNYIAGYVDARIEFFQYDLQKTIDSSGEQNYIKYSIPDNTTQNVTGTVTLTEDGMRSRFKLRFRDSNGWHTYTVKYQPDSTTVTRPTWVQGAEDWDDETWTDLEQELAIDARIDNVARFGGTLAGDYDCDNFSSQAAAQAAHERSGGAHGLDGDGDGVACEEL